MGKKCIFLDFDGVLNSRQSARIINSITNENGYGLVNKDSELVPKNVKLDPTCVALLQEIVEESNCDIVISSTWRMHLDIEHFIEIFKNYGWENAPVIDKTPVFFFKQRGDEINDWLEKHPEYDTYIIIDDSSDMLPQQFMYFVQTDHEIGLTRRKANLCK